MNAVKEGLGWLDEKYYLHPVIGRVIVVILVLAALCALAGYGLRQPWTVPCQMETRLCMMQTADDAPTCPPLDSPWCDEE